MDRLTQVGFRQVANIRPGHYYMALYRCGGQIVAWVLATYYPKSNTQEVTVRLEATDEPLSPEQVECRQHWCDCHAKAAALAD